MKQFSRFRLAVCFLLVLSASLDTAGVDSIDAWSIHPYRYPNSPEGSDLVGEVTRIARRVHAAGARRPTWVTEIGWPTHRTSRGSDEATQAR